MENQNNAPAPRFTTIGSTHIQAQIPTSMYREAVFNYTKMYNGIPPESNSELIRKALIIAFGVENIREQVLKTKKQLEGQENSQLVSEFIKYYSSDDVPMYQNDDKKRTLKYIPGSQNHLFKSVVYGLFTHWLNFTEKLSSIKLMLPRKFYLELMKQGVTATHDCFLGFNVKIPKQD